MVQIAVVDDDKSNLHLCRSCIRNMALSESTEIDCFESGKEFLDAVLKHDLCCYNILILSIDMPGITGFDVARILQEHEYNTIVIFCTACAHSVFEAFVYNPFWVVRKEHIQEELPLAVQSAINKIGAGNPGFLYLHYKNTDYRIGVQEIRYAEKSRNEITIHISGQNPIQVRMSIGELEEKLQNKAFLFVNSGVLVNMCYIQKIENTDVILDDGIRIPISRRRLVSFKQEFSRFMDEQG